MTVILILALIINAVMANLIAKQGEDRKIGYTNSFLVSFLLSPLIGILLVIASKPLTEAELNKKDEEELLGGPDSSHTVHDNHMRDMEMSEEVETETETEPEEENIIEVKDVCPACGHALTEEDTECPGCGLHF